MYCLGLDIGSSSIKASVLDVDSGECVGTSSYPRKEMEIIALQSGWAEQHPETWWENVILTIRKALSSGKISGEKIGAIGIAYQMHGLVSVDKQMRPVRSSIIWCDSRALDDGKALFSKAGKEKCMTQLLNPPGNFTLSKLHWVKTNQPEVFDRIHKIMLPGDYIAMKMTGDINTTLSGLSEGIMWDFRENKIASFLLKYAGIEQRLIADIVPTFGHQGNLTKAAAGKLNLPAGIPITYRAGDQPNNAFSLNVMNPGETAATAGTSGVVYGVTEQLQSDPLERVNTFAHVNYSPANPRLGILLCINGAGISNSWIRRITAAENFDIMNRNAQKISPGSEGLIFLPFGNGAERMLQNMDIGSSFFNINFNIHTQGHIQRAVQEGAAFAFHYGINIMKDSGMMTHVIRAGHTNMFLSDLFCRTLSSVSGTSIELYNTDGSLGAARGAAMGAGYYKSPSEAFESLKRIRIVEPDHTLVDQIKVSYDRWEKILIQQIKLQ